MKEILDPNDNNNLINRNDINNAEEAIKINLAHDDLDEKIGIKKLKENSKIEDNDKKFGENIDLEYE